MSSNLSGLRLSNSMAPPRFGLIKFGPLDASPEKITTFPNGIRVQIAPHTTPPRVIAAEIPLSDQQKSRYGTESTCILFTAKDLKELLANLRESIPAAGGIGQVAIGIIQDCVDTFNLALVSQP